MSRVRDEVLDRILAGEVPIAAASLSVLYGVLAVGHVVAMPPSAAWIMAPVALTTSLALAALYRRIRRDPPPLSWSHPLASLVAAAALANGALHLAMLGSAEHSINLLLLLIGASVFLTARPYFAAFLLGTPLVWLAIVEAFVPDLDRVHYGFAWALTLALATLIHNARRNTILRIDEAMNANEQKGARLQLALHDAGREIEDRRQAEEGLLRSEARKAAIIGSSLDALVEIDHHGRVVDANQIAFDLFGYAPDELLGHSLSDTLVPRDLRVAHRVGFDRYLESREPTILGKRLQLRALHRDGHEIPVELVVQPVLLDGEPPAFVGFLRDLRDQLAVEKELRVARDQAEDANRAKSAFLANVSHEIRTPMNAVLGMTELTLEMDLGDQARDYLGRAHGAAEGLLRMLDDLLDISRIEAGHRDPEQVEFDPVALAEQVLWGLSLQADEREIELHYAPDPRIPSRVVGEAGRLRQVLVNLVGNGIKFTREGSVDLLVSAETVAPGEMRLDFEVRDTGPGIPVAERERVFEQFEQGQLGREKGVGSGLGLAISARCVELAAEAAGRSGKLTVTSSESGSLFAFPWYVGGAVSTSRSEARGGVDLVGRDPGSLGRLAEGLRLEGWDAHPVEFDPDLRGPEGRRCVVDARRLGAETFERWLEGQAGAPPLMLASPADAKRLRRFADRVRFVPSPVSARTLSGRLDGAEPREGSTGGGRAVVPRRVLVVDDDDTNRLLVSESLRRRGHDVRVAHSGFEAVELYEPGRFDLVLLDLRMPGLDGFETAERLRAAEAEADSATRIFAMTAHAGPAEHARAREMGLAGVLSKPLRVLDLAELLTAPGAPQPAPVDERTLLSLSEGDAGLLARMVDTLEGSLEVDLANLERAVREQDLREIRRVCHKLRGGLAEFAATEALGWVEALRALASETSGEAAELEQGLADLRASLERLRLRLRELVAKHAPQPSSGGGD